MEIAFFGGNFLGLETSYMQCILDEAQSFVEKGLVDSIRFSTRPDTVTSKALKAMVSYSVGAVEVGAQSMDNTILGLSRRGHSAEDTARAAILLKDYGMRVGLQIMPGLPGDSPKSILETGRKTAELKPDFVRIYPVVVVKNTVLERWYREGSFEPLSLAEAVDVTKRLYLLFQARSIPVIRMGLQVTESLSQEGAVVAGPFHPAFGHLVLSAVFLDLATKELELQQSLPERVALRVHPHSVPKLRGPGNDNIKQLTERFHLQSLDVLPDPAVPENAIKVKKLPGQNKDLSNRIDMIRGF